MHVSKMTYCTLLTLVVIAAFSCGAPGKQNDCWPRGRFPKSWINPFTMAIKHRCNMPVKLQYHCYMQNNADRYAIMTKKADYLELNMWAIVHKGTSPTSTLDSWEEACAYLPYDSNNSRASSPRLRIEESSVAKLESDLASATADLETARTEIEELKALIEAQRTLPCLQCAELQRNYEECQVHFRILVAKGMRDTEAAEKMRIVERRRNMNLNKEIFELHEDLHNVMRLFVYNEEAVRQPQTLLEEALYGELVVLSFLIRGEVKETWIKIQTNNTVQVAIMTLNNDGEHITLGCVLHTTHNEQFNVLNGANWKADRTSIVLHFGDLVVTNNGEKVALDKAFRETLARGTTSSLLLDVADDGLTARLSEKRGRI